MLLHQNRHISAELSITSVSLLRMIRYENLRRHPNTASEDIDLCFRLSLPLLMAPPHNMAQYLDDAKIIPSIIPYKVSYRVELLN